VALRALEVEQLDGDGLRLPYAGLDPLIDPALVHGPEPALADEVAHREVPRRCPELLDRERHHVGCQPRQRQRHVLLLRRRRRGWLEAAGAVGVGGAEAAEDRGPRRGLSHVQRRGRAARCSKRARKSLRARDDG
jgi:hypothetical protein